MLTLPPTVRVYLATAPADMRKSFDGLSAAVMSVLGKDPTSGHLFVFRNRRGNHIRVLFWDRTGFCIFAKRLARGTFHFDVPEGARAVEIDAADLGLILEGIDLRDAQRRKRWRLPARDDAEASMRSP